MGKLVNSTETTGGDLSGGSWTVGTGPRPSTHACPNCGYCDKCGRGGYRAYPWAPYWGQPWWYGGGDTYVGDVPYGTVTVTCDSGNTNTQQFSDGSTFSV